MSELSTFPDPDTSFIKILFGSSFFQDDRINKTEHQIIFENHCILVNYNDKGKNKSALYRVIDKNRIYNPINYRQNKYNRYEIIDSIGWFHFVKHCTIPIINAIEFNEDNSYSGSPQFSLLDLECFEHSSNFSIYPIFDKLIKVTDFHALVLDQHELMREKMKHTIDSYRSIFDNTSGIIDELFNKSISIISFIYEYDDYKYEDEYSESDWTIKKIIDDNYLKNKSIVSDTDLSYLDQSVSSLSNKISECYMIIGQYRARQIELSIESATFTDNLLIKERIDMLISLRDFDNSYRSTNDRFHESEEYSDEFKTPSESNKYQRKRKLECLVDQYLQDLYSLIGSVLKKLDF